MTDVNDARAQICALIHHALNNGLTADNTNAILALAEQCRRVAVTELEDRMVADFANRMENE